MAETCRSVKTKLYAVVGSETSVYMGHLKNNAQGDKTVQWMMQSRLKLCQLQLKT